MTLVSSQTPDSCHDFSSSFFVILLQITTANVQYIGMHLASFAAHKLNCILYDCNSLQNISA